ncbi:outer membrane protein [Bradyrhizobium sp. HKCCYLRH3099]|uniref:outer membrane protein n=1 Tax=unclassified Bradyrhizobium TaxID=2631580 RepID=UPI003EBEDD8F
MLGTVAQAADLPLKAPAPIAAPAWAGFYVGTGFGFRANDADLSVRSATDTSNAPVIQNMFVAANCFAGLPCATGQSFNATAFRVSPYAGYNWQFGQFVAGIEGEFGFADQSRTSGSYYPAPSLFRPGSTTNSFIFKTTWDASIRARAGYVIDPSLLVYGTAGPSWIHVETTSNCSTLTAFDGDCAAGGARAFGPANITNSKTLLGYTVGGGLEALLTPNWIARAEYRYSDYGRTSDTNVRSSVNGTQTVTYDTALRTHTATFGIAYKFGGGPLASSLAAYAAMPETASWAGFYVGATAGVRANNVSSRVNKDVLATSFFTSDLAANCQCFLDSAYDTTAARIGPYIGYNWQIAPRWVVGIEGDAAYASAQATTYGYSFPGTALNGSSGGMNDSFSVRTKWDASIRARLGFVVNPSVMLYLTGGAAWTEIEQTSRCDTAVKALLTAPGFASAEIGSCAPGLKSPAVISQSSIRPGFTIGAGGETKLGRNWVLRGEYRYTDFGTANFTSARSCASTATFDLPGYGTAVIPCFATETISNSVRLQTHAAMFGISYKFD